MKNNWKLVYNPFEKVAGWKAFGIGIVILSITTIIGYFGNTVFYALEIKIGSSVTWSTAFFVQFLGLAVTVVIMYATALLFAKHTRFQDILGTVTLAKYPLLLVALVGLALGKSMAPLDAEKLIKMEYTFFDLIPLILFGVATIIFVVWEIALLYNAFRVSTNLKGLKCALLFIAVLLISEIVTLVLVSSIY
ncbi:MAG: YIP1 family protein [Candidatus Azobacteroides sp.]|nr:YIP1 family protein [Candidatus Azobacteroides sp.]